MNKEEQLYKEIARLKKENEELRRWKRNSSNNATVKVPDKFKPVFEKAEQIVGEYFKTINTFPEKGIIEINEQRYILVRASSLSHEFLHAIKNLYSDRDEKESFLIGKNFLFDISHVIGIADAKNFHKKMNLTDPIAKLSVGPVHFAYTGWAFVNLLPESRPTPDENFYLKYHHPFSFEADSWMRNNLKTNEPICIMNAGYSSGWCEASFGFPLTAIEISCKARGDEHCTFIMAPPHKIESYLEKEFLEKQPIDITIPTFFERKKIEEQLKASLKEKEILLKEIHHRVKNNLQIVSSLLKLQSNLVHDKNSKERFRESINRINAMSSIHEMLYNIDDFVNINIKDYIELLLFSLLQTYAIDRKNIEIVTEINFKKYFVDIKKAVPFGLILNELISNSLKHAFPNNGKGKIKIVILDSSIQESELFNYTLIVEDNGVGIPEHIDIRNTNTLGIVLIRTLTEQIDGVIQLDRSKGTKYTIKF